MIYKNLLVLVLSLLLPLAARGQDASDSLDIVVEVMKLNHEDKPDAAEVNGKTIVMAMYADCPESLRRAEGFTLPPSAFATIFDRQERCWMLFWLGARTKTAESQELWCKLSERYGKQELEDGVWGIPARWVSCEIILASLPQSYGRWWVIPESTDSYLSKTFANGTVVSTTSAHFPRPATSRRMLIHDLYKIKQGQQAGIDIDDRPTHYATESLQMFALFARDVNMALEPQPETDAEEIYDLTFEIDSTGKAHLGVPNAGLLPSARLARIASLSRAMESLQNSGFYPHFTVNGTPLPIYHVHAKYDQHNAWSFADHLWLNKKHIKSTDAIITATNLHDCIREGAANIDTAENIAKLRMPVCRIDCKLAISFH